MATPHPVAPDLLPFASVKDALASEFALLKTHCFRNTLKGATLESTLDPADAGRTWADLDRNSIHVTLDATTPRGVMRRWLVLPMAMLAVRTNVFDHSLRNELMRMARYGCEEAEAEIWALTDEGEWIDSWRGDPAGRWKRPDPAPTPAPEAASSPAPQHSSVVPEPSPPSQVVAPAPLTPSWLRQPDLSLIGQPGAVPNASTPPEIKPGWVHMPSPAAVVPAGLAPSASTPQVIKPGWVHMPGPAVTMPAGSVPIASAPKGDSEWWIADGVKWQGPVRLLDLGEWAAAGSLPDLTIVARSGMREGVALKRVIPNASPETQQHLRRYDALRRELYDRVIGVAERYQTGFYLLGRGGIGKTYNVEHPLCQLGKPFVMRTALMTPLGLFSLLKDHPDKIIVLDDVTELFKREQAKQILLAALGGKPGEPRAVSYVSNTVNETIYFSGGIIAISNLTLADDPVSRALKSRITPIEFAPSDQQIAAYVRQLALEPHQDLTASEQLDVVDFLIMETANFGIQLDLRHFSKALNHFRQYRDHKATTHWHDLVRGDLRQVVAPRARTEQEVALEIQERYPGRNQTEERQKAWTEATGKLTLDSYYRHVRPPKD